MGRSTEWRTDCEPCPNRADGALYPVYAKDLSPSPFRTLSSAIDGAIQLSSYGIAIFSPEPGGPIIIPNVAYELGIMMSQGKDVLILKDTKIQGLFANVADH